MKKILFADDEVNLLHLYREEFSEEGYYVILAENGKEAVEKFGEEKPDLVVMDINMPVMDGIESMNIILGKSRKTPIILSSAYPQHKHNYMTWGAEAFVVKSSDFTELKDKIREALQKEEKK